MTRQPSLGTILSSYSSNALKVMVRFWRDRKAANAARKQQAIIIVEGHLRDPEQVMAALSRLDEETLIMLAEAEKLPTLTSGKLLAACRARGMVDSREVLKQALGTGLLLALNTPRYGMIDFNDVIRNHSALILLPGLVGHIKAPSPKRETLEEVSGDKLLQVIPGDPARLVGTLVSFLGLLAKRKVKVSSGGWVHANQIGKLHRDLGLSEELLNVPLLIEIAKSMSLAREVDGLLRPEKGASSLVLLSSLPEVMKKILKNLEESEIWQDDPPVLNSSEIYGFIRTFEYYAPGIEHVVEGRKLTFSVMRRLDSSGWVDIERFVDLVLFFDPTIIWPKRDRYNYYSSFERQAEGPSNDYQREVQRELIRCYVANTLHLLGLVDLGRMGAKPYRFGRPKHAGQERSSFRQPLKKHSMRKGEVDKPQPQWQPKPCGVAFRLTPLGRQVLWGEAAVAEARPDGPAALIINPDFEVLAPLDSTPPELLLRLATYATLLEGHPTDPVRRFRLDKGALVQALKAGLELPSIIDELETHSGRPLPDNVARTLADWSAAFGKLDLYLDRDLLEFDSKAARNRFVAAFGQAESVDDTWALVPAGKGKKGVVIDYLDPPKHCLMLSATGRISVDRKTADLLVDTWLSSFAEPSSKAPRPAEYVITAQSVLRSRVKTTDLLEWLKTYVRRSEIPPGFDIMLRGLRGEMSPLAQDRVTLVQVENAKDRTGLLQHPNIKKCLLGVLESRLLVVKPGHLDELRKALASLGITVCEGIETR